MYWTLDGLYTVLPKSRVLNLVDIAGDGDIVVSPPNGAYQAIVDAGTHADTLIDAHLRGSYSVPLSTVPALIHDVSCAILAYQLYYASDLDEVPQKIRDAHRQAFVLLADIRDDKIRLFDEEQASGTISTNKTADDRKFPSSVLDRFF